MGENSSVKTSALGARTTRRRKHRTEVTEGGLWLIGKNCDLCETTGFVLRGVFVSEMYNWRNFRPRYESPGSGLCDLGAMLCFFAWSSDLAPRCSLRNFRPPKRKSPSVTSVTSVRCFLLRVVLAPDVEVFTTEFSCHRPNPPSVTSVTSVRCLPLRVVLAPDPKVVHYWTLSSLIFQIDPEKASFDEEREPRCRGL